MPALPKPGPGVEGQTRRLLNALADGQENACNVADLPPTGLPPGTRRFALNGLKDGETTGSGTGCPVYFDGSGWFRCCDDTAAAD